MGQVAPALIQGPQEMVRRSLLSYVRAQEEAADRAGVKFLNATQQSAKGMYLTFKRFADDQLVISSRIDPYQQTHPMPRERMAHLEDLIKTNGYWDKGDAPELQQRHDMMRAKLAGFLDRPDTVTRRYPPSDTSLPTTARRSSSRASGSSPRRPLRGRKSAGVPLRNDRIMWMIGFQCSGGIARSGPSSTIQTPQSTSAITSSTMWLNSGSASNPAAITTASTYGYWQIFIDGI